MAIYTSLKLSKLFAENGCDLDSEIYRDYQNNLTTASSGSSCKGENGYTTSDVLPYFCAYDLLYDICIRYAKEFFGEKEIDFEYEEKYYNKFLGGVLYYPYDEGACMLYTTKSFLYHSQEVFYFLQQGKQDEAEEYIWKNCLFNPENK